MNQRFHFATRFAASQDGSMAVLFAIASTVVLGFAALAIDASSFYATKVEMQNAADSAAISAVKAYAASDKEKRWVTEGKAIAASYGYGEEKTGGTVTVTVNSPPTRGKYTATGEGDYIEARITKHVKPFFAQLLGQEAVTLTAYGVAGRVGTSTACVLSNTTIIVNDANIDLSSCSAAANSTGSQAFLFNSGAKWTSAIVTTPGGITQNSGTTVNAQQLTKQNAVVDPYAGLTYDEPKDAACKNWADGNYTKTPGCYWGTGFTGNYTLSPGTYYFKGDMNMNGGGSGTSITGTGVTLVFLGGFNPGSGRVNLKAPTASTDANANYDYKGIVIFKPNGGDMNFNSDTTLTFDGAIYAPKSTFNLNAGTETTTQCNQIVANQITFNSKAKLYTNCSAVPVRKVAVGNGTSIAQ
jgi:hypothetical protein